MIKFDETGNLWAEKLIVLTKGDEISKADKDAVYCEMYVPARKSLRN